MLRVDKIFLRLSFNPELTALDFELLPVASLIPSILPSLKASIGLGFDSVNDIFFSLKIGGSLESCS